MSKLRIFFRTYFKSLTDPIYYQDILKAKLTFSLKYFLVFYALTSLINTVDYNFRLKPQIQTLSREAIHNLSTGYPNSLVLSVTNDQLSVTGVSEPINVPFPDYLNVPELTRSYDHLATINSQEEYPKNNSLITLTKSAIFVRKSDGSKESYPYAEFDSDFTITRDQVELAASVFQSTLDKIITYSPIIFFLGNLFFQPIIALLVLLIYSLFIWLTSSILNKSINYPKSFQIGLHLITFAETVVIIQSLLFPNFSYSQLFPIAFFAATALVLFSLHPVKMHQTKPSR